MCCCAAAAAQVNSSAVHRVYSNSARPLLASSAAVISRHHKLPTALRRGSAGSAVGDISNIPSSSVTTETMVERSHASSNSSSESSDRHLYDCPHAPAQVCLTDQCHFSHLTMSKSDNSDGQSSFTHFKLKNTHVCIFNFSDYFGRKKQSSNSSSLGIN